MGNENEVAPTDGRVRFSAAEVRRASEWTAWARVNETREGRIERRYKVVCKANMPQHTDLRVQVKTNERFCAAGSDDTCAGERVAPPGGYELGPDPASPYRDDLEPLLALIAMAVCKSGDAGASSAAGNEYDDKASCGTVVNGTCVCPQNNNTDRRFDNGKHDDSSGETVHQLSVSPMEGFSGDTIVGSGEENFFGENNTKPNEGPSPSEPRAEKLSSDAETQSTGPEIGESPQNYTTQGVESSTEPPATPESVTDERTKQVKNCSSSTPAEDNTLTGSSSNTENKTCDCAKEPQRPAGPPWSHGEVFQGYCKCRDLGIFRTCRKCPLSVP